MLLTHARSVNAAAALVILGTLATSALTQTVVIDRVARVLSVGAQANIELFMLLQVLLNVVGNLAVFVFVFLFCIFALMFVTGNAEGLNVFRALAFAYVPILMSNMITAIAVLFAIGEGNLSSYLAGATSSTIDQALIQWNHDAYYLHVLQYAAAVAASVVAAYRLHLLCRIALYKACAIVATCLGLLYIAKMVLAPQGPA